MEQLIAALPYLACPIGMGLMMWMMSRRQQDGAPVGPRAGADASTTPPIAVSTAPRDAQLAELREELARVRTQQEAIAREIEAVATEDSAPVPRDATR